MPGNVCSRSKLFKVTKHVDHQDIYLASLASLHTTFTCLSRNVYVPTANRNFESDVCCCDRRSLEGVALVMPSKSLQSVPLIAELKLKQYIKLQCFHTSVLPIGNAAKFKAHSF